MRRNVLALGALVLSLSVNAQFVANVGNGAKVYVEQKAKVYSGGGMKTIGGGQIINSGDIKIVGRLATKKVEGDDKTDGGNIILRLNDHKNFSNYGQLWIDNTNQGELTGIVTKEYRDISHGTYQQLALPFINKKVKELNSEIPNLNLIDTRFFGNKASNQNLLYFNQTKIQNDLLTVESTTGEDPTRYYILGAVKLTSDYFPGTTSNIKGVPAKSQQVKVLKESGKGVVFGNEGNGRNEYRQKYNGYWGDSWEMENFWTGNFGRDIYQYGNPFLTNLDLTLLSNDNIDKIRGIRYSVTGTNVNLAAPLEYKFMNFTAGSGTAVGDVKAAIIKPMQEFVIKLKAGQETTIDFASLRTFDYEPKNKGIVVSGSDVVAARHRNRLASKTKHSFSSESVKQLDVIALDANKNEIGRTYYVVYGTATTGRPEGYTTQSIANNKNIIGTFEEDKNGGVDAETSRSYWLYINEANEVDFKGKKIPLGLYSNKIAYLKFVVRENVKEVENSGTLSSGENFYVTLSSTGKAIKIGQDDIIAVGQARSLGLYYGYPDTGTLSTGDVILDKPSETIVVLDSSESNYKVLFDKTWKTASIQVYDLSGKVIIDEKDVNASTPYTIKLPEAVDTVYVVVAVSESGKKYSQKIKTVNK